MKKIRDYFCKNGVYIWKEAKKSIIDSLLEVIYKLIPLKWPTNDSANNFTDGPINGPTNNLTLALLLLLTTPV